MKLYRFLTEDDTSAFCHKVTAALNKGWELHGQPTYAFDAANGVMRCQWSHKCSQVLGKDDDGQDIFCLLDHRKCNGCKNPKHLASKK